MEEVTLRFADLLRGGLPNDGWADIARALERPAYAYLREIRIVVEVVGDCFGLEALETAISQHLSSFDARGLLTFFWRYVSVSFVLTGCAVTYGILSGSRNTHPLMS